MSGPIRPRPYVGTYETEAALLAAIPTGNDGTFAIVDAGAGTDAVLYIYDATDGWIAITGAPPGGVTTITADTTLPVPGTYATLQAAIDYAESVVVLNGATVTIDVAAGTTLAEQPVITQAMPWLQINGAGAGVNVDTAAFIANTPPGVPTFLRLDAGAEVGAILGSWAMAGAVSSLFLFSASATVRTGTIGGGTCTITGAGSYGMAFFASVVKLENTTIDGQSVGAYFANASQAYANACTFSYGVGCTGGASVSMSGCTMGVSPALSACLGADTGGTVEAGTCTLNVSAAADALSLAMGGTIKAQSLTVNIAGGSTGRFAYLRNGTLVLRSVTAVGGSTGNAIACSEAGMAQVFDAASLSVSYPAGNTLAANTPSAAGLILTS